MPLPSSMQSKRSQQRADTDAENPPRRSRRETLCAKEKEEMKATVTVINPRRGMYAAEIEGHVNTSFLSYLTL